MATGNGSRLREARRRAGVTQAELAARAAVSRQLVAAAEAGHNAPAVDAALRLAGALGRTVEELFGVAPERIVPALDDQLPDGAAVRVGRVGDQLVAARLPPGGACGSGWAAPDGVLTDGELLQFPGPTPAGLVIAGCDPALGLAETMLAGHGPSSLLAISAPTGTAIRALARGTVHATVVHGPAEALPRPPVAVVRRHLARWQVGLGVSPRAAGGSEEAIIRHTPVVQRDPAASSQQAFERYAARVGLSERVSGPRAVGHIDAARTASILGAAAVTTESAAHAFGLRFLALEPHTVEIWVAERFADHPGARALGELLSSSAFTRRLRTLGGYELADCGRTLSRLAAG